MSYHYSLENGNGALELEDASGDYLLENAIILTSLRVKAVTPGYYQGIYRDIGDVFDLASAADFSDSTVSQVPAGNPLYPLYGWMLSVPSTTALYRWAAYGNSSPVNGIYQPNAVGAVNLSIPRYVE